MYPGRGVSARRRVHPVHVPQARQQVLRIIVEHHGVAKPLRVQKLDRPLFLRDGPTIWPSMKAPESSDPHEEKAAGMTRASARRSNGFRCWSAKIAAPPAPHEPVGGHPPKPQGGNESEMLPVEGPFVERDLHGTAADEDADGHEEAQAPDLTARQVQRSMTVSQEEMKLQEPEGKAWPVPPEGAPR